MSDVECPPNNDYLVEWRLDECGNTLYCKASDARALIYFCAQILEEICNRLGTSLAGEGEQR